MKKLVVMGVLLVAMVSLIAQGTVEVPQTEPAAAPAATVSEASAVAGLSAEVIDGLLQMREEEKLARDVYLTLFDMWGIRTFSQIAKSEETHMNAVGVLFDQFGLDDPITTTTVGVFTDPEIAALYESLVAAGSASAQAALQVGATIEDLDIYDLEVLLAQTNDPDITRVYTNLLKGSENHMRSFTGQLAKYGETYEAVYVSADRLAGILARK